MPYIRGSEVGSKKRYAGLVYENGKPKMIYKGLESVRSDWTTLARAFQQELYQRVFLQQPYKEWLYAEVQALLHGEKDQDLIYRKRLGQPLIAYIKNVPPHAQAARKLEQWLKAQGQPARLLTMVAVLSMWSHLMDQSLYGLTAVPIVRWIISTT